MSPKDLRNNKARARDEWLESDEGKVATTGSASGQYLHNRVENGFCSGWDAAMRQQDVGGLVRLRESLANPNNLASYSHLGRGGAGALSQDVVMCLDKIIANGSSGKTWSAKTLAAIVFDHLKESKYSLASCEGVISDALATSAQGEEEKLTLDNALVQVEKSQKYVRQLANKEHIPANIPDVYDGLGGALALAMKYLLGLQNRIGVPKR